MRAKALAASTLLLPALILAAGGSPVTGQLGPIGTQSWNLASPDVAGPAQEGALAGSALAAGDFNCDGFEDLAVGLPLYDVDILANAGALLVLYGSEDGLTATGSQFFDQFEPDLPDVPEEHDSFASALAAGYFNGDGCDELAVGVPFENFGAGEDADNDVGEVIFLLGSEDGLEPGYGVYQGWDQGGVIAGIAEAGDRFGQALLAYDFDEDGFDDLAIGVPGEDLGGEANAGAVNVLFGSAAYANGARDIVLFRGSGELPGEPQAGEQLGLALAAGNFNDGAGRELAIGAPFQDLPDAAAAGGVLIVSDLAGSLPVLERNAGSAGVPGEVEAGAHFGAALAAGDFDGDGRDELAVGIPGQGLAGDPADTGAVSVIDFGGPDSSALWTQEDLNPENAEASDQLGDALAAGDFDADGTADLAIGVSFEDLGPLTDSGLLHVLHGAPETGLSNAGDQTWLQTIDPSEGGDRFGFALATGRFAGHTGLDLAIGVPAETIGAAEAAGAFNVLYSAALFLDGFESGDTSAWTTTVE